MMYMYRYFALALILLISVVPGFAAPPAALAQDEDPLQQQVNDLVARMPVADRVGQLFLVTFVGNDVGPASDIARLIQEYRIGGVALLASNGNFRNEGDTPVQVATLANQLQGLAFGQVIPKDKALSPDAVPEPAISPSYPITEVNGIPFTTTAPMGVPLFVALDQEGDGYPYTRLINGFTPLPSNMALGATWNPDNARETGVIVGRELSAVGVNMLFGPSLDVLDEPKPGQRGDMGTRTFGGDPYWVGRLGRAYIHGVHEGSGGRLATVAKHFPGQGSSDRRPDEEVAAVQKTLSQLRQIELPPFAAVTAVDGMDALDITDAMMSSHIRYSGFQDNIRQLTPPISLAPQLQSLMEQPEFARWRMVGGVLVSDALGAPALRRYKDPALKVFPHRQVALEAFLAGNDLLYLSQFALTGDYAPQLANIKSTIEFFRERYMDDPGFRTRVDESLRRILRLKLRLMGDPETGGFRLHKVLVDSGLLSEVLGQGNLTVARIAQEAVTLISPSPSELAYRLPTSPLPDERILVITDDRTWQECIGCPPVPYIPQDALEKIMLRLYGPEASAQVSPEQIHSTTFSNMKVFLDDSQDDPRYVKMARQLEEADWIIFAMLDVQPGPYPESDAVKEFLRVRADSLRGKKLIVMAFNAPYYLDATEISKLTAYYGLYAKTPPFLEAAVRALFREFSPSGAPPVDVVGINYDLFRTLEPGPEQIISLLPVGVEGKEQVEGGTEHIGLKVGDTLRLATSVIVDRNGHPVPDGTPVQFRFRYPAAGVELPPQEVTTVNGVAETSVKLERTGELVITASSGPAKESSQLLVSIEGSDELAVIATVVPTPTATPTFTATPTPTATATATATPTPTPTDTPTPTPTPISPPLPRVDTNALGLALIAVALASGLSILLQIRQHQPLAKVLRLALWGVVAGLTAYVLYGLGWIPSATAMQRSLRPWGAGLVALAGGLVPLLIAGIRLLVEQANDEI